MLNRASKTPTLQLPFAMIVTISVCSTCRDLGNYRPHQALGGQGPQSSTRLKTGLRPAWQSVLVGNVSGVHLGPEGSKTRPARRSVVLETYSRCLVRANHAVMHRPCWEDSVPYYLNH